MYVCTYVPICTYVGTVPTVCTYVPSFQLRFVSGAQQQKVQEVAHQKNLEIFGARGRERERSGTTNET